jgi:AraC-like DNA-binding protein
MKPPQGSKTGQVGHTENAPAVGRERWTASGWPSVVSLFDAKPVGEFRTSSEMLMFDEVALVLGTGTACRFDRTAKHTAGDGLKALAGSIWLEGSAQGIAGGLPFAVEAGQMLLVDMTQEISVTMTDSRVIQFGVPRVRAEREIGPVSRLHGWVIDGETTGLLQSHLLQLFEGLKRIPESDAERVARTLIDTLALSVRVAGEGGAWENVAQPLVTRAHNEIRRNLGSPALNVAGLCRRLGVSRSTVHRLFEAEGGVQAYIRNLRLDEARTALLNGPVDQRIADVAERLGFSDAAHLSRLFRQRFGESPSECRGRARAAGGAEE